MGFIESAKKRAAEKSVEHIKDGYVLGLGSGSTATVAIRMIGELLREGSLKNILGVPTSIQSAYEAIEAGIPLTTLDEHPILDLCIDGVDQMNENLDAIKGKGGALLREKVVASASKKYIFILDETKISNRLGLRCPVPLEIHPFSAKPVLLKIRKMGAKATIRMVKEKLGPLFTDNGNFLVDADFGEIGDVKELEAALKRIPGVLETGLFIEMADIAYIGTKTSVLKYHRRKKL
ncbi:ribose 5-phosphate isomerase A [Candidatus Bathyarchaeota archaeon]|nr:ribose 5-phosphate isomerase A [Candidatus Bathyarchaeota archaeon]MBS7630274.1 ribose 5-phosphate isomerase A [Candidatus Bathyarchaeota archaeon]